MIVCDYCAKEIPDDTPPVTVIINTKREGATAMAQTRIDLHDEPCALRFARKAKRIREDSP